LWDLFAMLREANLWQDADQSLEDPGEVALIVQAKLCSDSRQRQLCLEQQASRLVNTRAQKIGLRVPTVQNVQ
jgi:hypothetical protein